MPKKDSPFSLPRLYIRRTPCPTKGIYKPKPLTSFEVHHRSPLSSKAWRWSKQSQSLTEGIRTCPLFGSLKSLTALAPTSPERRRFSSTPPGFGAGGKSATRKYRIFISKAIIVRLANYSAMRKLEFSVFRNTEFLIINRSVSSLFVELNCI